MPPKGEAELAIRELVQQLTNTWTSGNLQRLGEFFDENVLMLPPGSSHPLLGRNAMVQTFQEFLSVAKVEKFEQVQLQVDVFDDTAIANLNFDIRYEMDGQLHDDSAMDVMVFAKGAKGWRIVWRTQVPT